MAWWLFYPIFIWGKAAFAVSFYAFTDSKSDYHKASQKVVIVHPPKGLQKCAMQLLGMSKCTKAFMELQLT
ncbi:MAG: hypothetical protein KIH08_08540 [Candidatus Freyarchaeota archaeon]|nr:hypothetical protein [Candidatus Jordarchaeia archaeon]MBS7270225.1 hypothetical protein [Candidatus Jordarchaeia archaeon]MBS7280519.1 hypothetical protein [Candidatus Jordarchaeia archaeon]